ncbi:Uncharacterised protein [Mycobacterium tuberculosis]|nr:hypothetical protein FF22_01431 [Mycobacterium tuberculosis]CKN62014.1 Uncharacterised protein [Mycobacterium tuberculosis]CKN82421.1 Uncharacterised protein [Mycobacterium tuberculosis]CKO84591.1 Uncharacterised protein [Mycobacterium tuberculosis]CKT44638.1 Uncharacterised protein [Mycobacterium tuberculosis]
MNVFFARFHEIMPPVNFCETTSPSTVWSPTGAPSLPLGPRSLSHAATMAPRTTNAPWSGVQKITGLSAAENLTIRLEGPKPPSVSLAMGKPKSLLTGPPSDSYFARISPSTAFAPVAGLKKTLPPTKSWAIPSPPIGYCPPFLAPSGPAAPPAARQAMLIAAEGSIATCKPFSCSASTAGTVVNSLVARFQETSPPLNFWAVTSPS